MGWLVIVRHGNTFDRGDTVLRVGGRTDIPLSQSGQVQADALADHFSGQAFDHVLCGPLLRQSQTAAAIVAKLASPEALEIEPRLTEVDYGPDEGQAEVDVVARVGEAALKRWETERIPHPDWQIDEPGLRRLWAELLERSRTQSIMVITSNGTARYIFDHVARRDAPFKLRTGAFGVIDGDDRALVFWDERPPT